MRFFGRNKKNASDLANERVSKRIAARTNAPDAKREIPVVILPPVEDQVFVEEFVESASDDTAELEQEDVKRVDLSDSPMTGDEDGRSAIVFAQDFVEELTEMVSEDAARITETDSYCCGGV